MKIWKTALLCLGFTSPLCAATPSPGEAEGPTLEVSSRKLDFGRLAQGRSAVRKVTLMNAGDETLRLRRLGVNCECASLRLSTPRRLNVPIDVRDEGRTKLALEPGENATLTVTVDTSGLATGSTQHRCLIYSNDKESSPLELELAMTIEKVEGAAPLTPAVPPAAEPAGPPILIPDRETHDFGEVMRGETAQTTFELTNKGDRDLNLQTVRSTCSCTASRMWIGDRVIEAEELTELQSLGILKPGEVARVEVELSTGSVRALEDRPNMLRKAVRVFHDDAGNSPTSLTITAAVVSPVRFEPEHLRFGRIRRSEGAALSTEMKSVRLEGYHLTKVEVPRPEILTAEFVELEGGEQPSYRIDVKVKPGAPLGPVSGALKVHLDHPRVRELELPILLQIGPDVEFRGNDRAGAERLDFGILAAGEEHSAELTIENFDPSKPYEPKDIEITARPDPAPFRYEIVEVEKGVKYTVRLTVGKDLAARYFSGRLRIVSDHTDLPEKFVDFRGWQRTEEQAAAADAGGE